MTSETSGRKPDLEYPEDGRLGDRELFYDEVVSLLGPATWCTAIIIPSEFKATRRRIERDCHNLLTALELPKNTLAWLVPFHDVKRVLPGLFGALKPELILMAFDFQPNASDIDTAFNAEDASPAAKLLYFRDSELYEIAEPKKP